MFQAVFIYTGHHLTGFHAVFIYTGHHLTGLGF
ncbi:hypothetical protein Ccrd_022271 [Cynara cardunculus var. scolymus]|uniref:Uncharacterized protein n=1 Tax=Cynara cardunculus var. scolymus TaxID=59895 RepID=A0A103XZ23_CYNCS|nr:hypothetical protein Ccrd_022271 [Cynara cardunculus var. scolymus]